MKSRDEELPRESVQVEFSLAVGGGRLDASVEVPAGRVTLTQLLPVLQGLTSNLVDGVAEIVHSEGHTISCRAGCGACCRQMVPISLFEAEGLLEWIGTLPQEQQAALRTRFDDALRVLRERGLLERMGAAMWVANKQEREAFGLEYLKARVACPFLVEESCSIHPIRPLVCREYLVTSPAEYCAVPDPEKVERVEMPVRPSMSLFRMAAMMESHGRGWIPLVFLFALQQRGPGPGSAVMGTGPELLRRFVELMSPDPVEAPER
jgi:Fe-S-cluster containining protein